MLTDTLKLHILQSSSEDLKKRFHRRPQAGQKIRVDGNVGTIKQAGSLHIIMENDKGKTILLPTKMIADEEVIIESRPEPEVPEKGGKNDQRIG